MASKKRKKSKMVWVATGHSESGDDDGPFTFAKKPTEAELAEFWRENGDYDPDYEDAPGDYGTFVHTCLEKCSVD